MLESNKNYVIFEHLCVSDKDARRDCFFGIARTRDDRIALQQGAQYESIARQSDRAATVHNCKPKNQFSRGIKNEQKHERKQK